MKKSLLLTAFVTMAILITSAASVFAQAIDVTGKWNMKVETSAGSGSPVFVLKQSKDSISGTYTGQLGEAAVKGTMKDKEIRLEFKGGEVACIYTGSVDGNSMKGKAVFGELGEGTFTGTKEAK